MKRNPLILTALPFALLSNSHATCITRPEVRSEVRVVSCSSAAFGASDVSLARSGQRVSGALLVVDVKSSELVWSPDTARSTSEVTAWRNGDRKSLFVAKPSTDVCPKHVPAELTVVTSLPCCDTLPATGVCLLPESVVLVTISDVPNNP